MADESGWLLKEAARAEERLGLKFTPASLAAHDAVVERNLRLRLSDEILALATNEDLLGALLRLETPMADGARMALEVAADLVRLVDDQEETHARGDR